MLHEIISKYLQIFWQKVVLKRRKIKARWIVSRLEQKPTVSFTHDQNVTSTTFSSFARVDISYCDWWYFKSGSPTPLLLTFMAVGEADNISRCLLSISTLLGACRALWGAEGEAFFPWALGVHKGRVIVDHKGRVHKWKSGKSLVLCQTGGGGGGGRGGGKKKKNFFVFNL